jgi:transposase
MAQAKRKTPDPQQLNVSIGVDISKDKFDVCTYPGGDRRCFTNDKTGFKTFLKWLACYDVERVVFEPTGAYHHDFERFTGERGVPLCKVNPFRARNFAKSTGTRMKTDEVDAWMLAKMGAQQNLALTPITTQDIDTMRELVVARTALMKDKIAASNRKATARHPIIKAQLTTRLKQINASLAEIDAAIAAIIAANPDLKARKKILMSIKGIGALTAHFLIANMPELGEISNNQAASLAGLAPIMNQSGKHFGKAHIGGGRKNVRNALYMPALVAIQHNKDLTAKYQTMLDAHIPKKVATIAIMRKLLILANTLIKKNKLWTETRP